MVIDSSALIAILNREPEADVFAAAIERDPKRLISTASVLESAIVLDRLYGEEGGRQLDRLIVALPIEVVPMDIEQLAWARHAHHTYGRGQHKAALNYGDCFPYALAKVTGEPLLYKGFDFQQTDIVSALEESI
jgi:ribonuclease VapC